MNTKLISTLCVTNCCPTELSTVLKVIIGKLALSINGRYLTRKRYKQFCAILLYITKKLGTGFIVKICQKSYACLRSRSDNQSNLHLVDQSLKNTRRVSRSPTKYLQSTTLFSKTSGSSTGSQKSELQD